MSSALSTGCAECGACVSLRSSLPLGFAPDLDRDLIDAEGDRRLGLGGLHPHALELVVGEQPVGDRAAQSLERPVRALLGDQRDELADLGVVDVSSSESVTVASVSPTSRRRSSTSRWPTSRSASVTPWWV